MALIPPSPEPPPRVVAEETPAFRPPRWEAALRDGLPPLMIALAILALLGTGGLVATLVEGWPSIARPSARWLAIAGGVAAGGGATWWLASIGAARAGWRRWEAAAWPVLALLPAAAAAPALWLDGPGSSIVSGSPPVRQELLAYTGLCFAGGQIAFWLAVAVRRRGVLTVPPATAVLTPLLLTLAVAAYVNVTIISLWLPANIDFGVNLIGAQKLLSGQTPYTPEVPVWNDRVHQLPTTLLLLFGPFTVLSRQTAGLVYFLANQVCWVAALWLFIRRLVAPPHRLLWLAGGLAFGATYWPWQESIRFGQPDGLLLLLFTWSITSAALQRDLPAGIALGLAFPVKPISIWLPLVYLMHGRWRTLAIAAATAVALALGTLFVTGWEVWRQFVFVEIPAMLPGTVRGTNIPLPSLHARLFVARSALGDGNPAPTYLTIQALNASANVLGMLFLGHLAVRRRRRGQREWLLDASLGLTLTVLLAPYAWQHYATWLTLCFLVLALPRTWQPLSPATRACAALLTGAAFLLLSLNDERLIRLLTPPVNQWPALMSFYTPGLLALVGALAIARIAPSSDAALD